MCWRAHSGSKLHNTAQHQPNTAAIDWCLVPTEDGPQPAASQQHLPPGNGTVPGTCPSWPRSSPCTGSSGISRSGVAPPVHTSMHLSAWACLSRSCLKQGFKRSRAAARQSQAAEQQWAGRQAITRAGGGGSKLGESLSPTAPNSPRCDPASEVGSDHVPELLLAHLAPRIPKHPERLQHTKTPLSTSDTSRSHSLIR